MNKTLKKEKWNLEKYWAPEEMKFFFEIVEKNYQDGVFSENDFVNIQNISYAIDEVFSIRNDIMNYYNIDHQRKIDNEIKILNHLFEVEKDEVKRIKILNEIENKKMERKYKWISFRENGLKFNNSISLIDKFKTLQTMLSASALTPRAKAELRNILANFSGGNENLLETLKKFIGDDEDEKFNLKKN